MGKVVLGLGSNMGDRGWNIREALVQLEKWGVRILRTSSLYETEPFGDKDQDWYLNMAAIGETNLEPEDLLKAINAIEKALKRERVVQWGPRTIDIDILFFDHRVIDVPGLAIPHPGITERRFVLLPLAEIAPDLVHPALNKTAAQLLKECTDSSIVNLHY